MFVEICTRVSTVGKFPEWQLCVTVFDNVPNRKLVGTLIAVPRELVEDYESDVSRTLIGKAPLEILHFYQSKTKMRFIQFPGMTFSFYHWTTDVDQDSYFIVENFIPGQPIHNVRRRNRSKL